MTDHYRLLGVGRNAKSATIREAYLYHMKRYHPDAPDGARDEGRKARDINRAYAVLRSPVARSIYDRQLNQIRSTRPSYRLLRAVRQPSRGKKIGGAVAATAILVSAGLLFNNSDGGALQRKLWAGGKPSSLFINEELPPHQSDIAGNWNGSEAVSDLRWVIANTDAGGIETFSRNCYKESRSYPSSAFLDRCFAFDIAAGLWLSHSGERIEDSVRRHFSLSSNRARYLRAAASLSWESSSARARMGEIERQAPAFLARRKPIKISNISAEESVQMDTQKEE